ncbi:response regulator [Bacillus lacus]|uniref:Response regulator n=2 Tax=Metabacillus lacus TaxID=1983721 RepID=A0A7X2J093_9BACI|nr:response regulator [Metabacillus lacus]
MILLSARHTEKDKVYGLGIGANDFVAKPFSISELKARVIAHLRSFERISKNEGVLSNLRGGWKTALAFWKQYPAPSNLDGIGVKKLTTFLLKASDNVV